MAPLALAPGFQIDYDILGASPTPPSMTMSLCMALPLTPSPHLPPAPNYQGLLLKHPNLSPQHPQSIKTNAISPGPAPYLTQPQEEILQSNVTPFPYNCPPP